MKHKVVIEFDDSKDAISCGLRQSWITGTRGNGKNEVSIDLSCGAGVGSPFLIFAKSSKGKVKYLIADIREAIKQLDLI